MRNCRRRVCWSDLPKKILRSIAQLLDENPDDLGHFRGVCKNWYCSTSVSALLPTFVDERSNAGNYLFSSSVILLRPRVSVSDTIITSWMVSVVEKTQGNVQLYHPFYETPLPHLPQNLDLSHFQSSRLALAYHNQSLPAMASFQDFELDFSVTHKVLLFSEILTPCFGDCSLLYLRYGRLGGYPLVETENGEEWVDISFQSTTEFDDIVNFGGVICALDLYGRLLKINTTKFHEFKILVDIPFAIVDPLNKGCRKRLVQSSVTRKLYLVRKMMRMFRVYELNCKSRYWEWVEVQSFGDGDQILFVTKNYCFFAAAADFPGCQLGHCIVFSHDALPHRSESGWEFKAVNDDEEEPQIYRLGTNDDGFKPISSYPYFPVNLWSPPHWVSRDHTPLSQSQPHRQPVHNKGVQLVSSTQQEVAPLQKLPLKKSVLSFGPDTKKRTIGTIFTSATQEGTTGTLSTSTSREETTKIPSTTNDVDVIGEASHFNTPREERSTHSVSRAYITSITESNRTDTNSTVKFEGLDIRSNLLPILQKIWSKHGNLLENSIIRSGDMVARALESLATMVLILEENSMRSLSASQIDCLSLTLSDLRCMQFKVDWLAPCVEKAVGLHKSKPLMECLDKLVHCKARVTGWMSKLLEELAEYDKMDDELEEHMANVSKLIPFSGNADFDQPIGGGLS